MQMAVTVGEVLYQRENPLPFAWRCHLDKARENEVGMSGRQEESLASHMKEQGVEKESYKKKQKWGSDVNRIHLDKAGESEVGMSGRQEQGFATVLENGSYKKNQKGGNDVNWIHLDKA